MISINNVIKFCKEDPSLIENYDKAINDETQTWVCHHRLEIDENKSVQQLKDENRYYNRPAAELIFLTRAEHTSIHAKEITSETRLKISDGHKGKKQSKEAKHKISKYRKDWCKTHEHPGKDKNFITNGKDNKLIDISEFHIYEVQGYRWGLTRNKNKIK